jgi:glycosyltransferase involved in cell wall biosynthesis
MTHLNPTVSVVIPCYNQGQYLDEAIESVLSQTYQHFEIIVINDGSTDPETIEILKNYQKPKTRIIHTENQGVIAARNQAIKASQGKYILPLDADDKIGSTYLEEAVELLEANENLGIVYCEAEFFGKQTGKWELPEYKFPNILLSNMIFCSGFFRKSDWQQVNGYNPNMVDGWEDYDFWLSIIELGREVYRIPKILFCYRRKLVSRTEAIDSQKFVKLHTYVFRNHAQLYGDNIDVVFAKIVDFKERIKLAKERIKQLEKYEKDLKKSQEQIKAMESSKFWQLRNLWFTIKHRLRLTKE